MYYSGQEIEAATGRNNMTTKVPYAHWRSCIMAFLEQLPIQIFAIFRKKKRYLFCFCSAVETVDGHSTFTERDRMGNKIWARLRFDGYAAAIRGSFADELVLFGPKNETLVATSALLDKGVPLEKIQTVDTRVSTIGNSDVMRSFIRSQSIPIQWVRMSSSAYHIRAPIFAFKGCLVVRHVPAEVFLFAGKNEEQRARLRDRLIQEYGDSELTRRFVYEIQGIFDGIYGTYDIPNGG